MGHGLLGGHDGPHKELDAQQQGHAGGEAAHGAAGEEAGGVAAHEGEEQHEGHHDEAVADVEVFALAVGPGGDGAGAAEEKTEFDVELTEVGPNKVKVIKVVREATGLGLKEAKEVVDGAPKVIKEQAEKAEAEDIKAKLEAEGAKVTLK